MNLKNEQWTYRFVAFLILVLWGAWLATQAYLPGTDGYYLLDQAGEILKSGTLRIKNHDPTPFLAAGLIRAGVPPETSVKLLLFLAGAAWLWLGRRAAFSLFFWMTPIFFYHLVQFPKLSFSILLAAQAFLSATPWATAFFGALVCLFHPVGLACLVLGRVEKWKHWIPWVAVLALNLCFPALGYWWRDQTFSLLPVGYKLLADPHFPNFLRIGFAGWIVLWALRLEKGWLALGLLAPSSQGELIGTTERWVLALLLFSPWILQARKGKLYFALLAPLLVWLMLQEIPKYDYGLMDEVISKTKNMDFKMLVADQTGKFYFTAKTGRDAYFFEPEDDWPKSSIWRVAQQVSPGELLPYLKGGCAPGTATWFALRPDTMLIREDCWVGLRAGFRKDENEDLYDRVWNSSLNPSKKRSAFLRNRQLMK